MIQYSLEVAICWAILYLVYITFLRKETFFAINRWYLLSSLVLGLLIPVLRTIPLALQEEAVVVNEALYFISAGPEFIAENIVAQAASESIFTINNLLLLIYVLGLLFVGSRLILGLAKIKALYTSGIKTRKDSFTLILTNKFHLPFSFLNCVFFSKEMPINGSIEKILKHELTHVQSWHTLDVLFTEVLQVLFWFNPLIILYKKAIKESHEYVADASVLKDTSQKIYGQILLRQSQSGLQIALANHFFHSHIKKRLTMMKQKKSKWPAMIKYLFALPVIVLLMVLFQSQTLPLDKSQNDSGFPQELLNAFSSENAYDDVKKFHAQKLQEFLEKEIRKDFEELYHATDHNRNIMETVKKFDDLLKSYLSDYPNSTERIKSIFQSTGRSMGMKIKYGAGDLSFDQLVFIVPDKSLLAFQAGKLPEYDLLLDRDDFSTGKLYGNMVTEGDTFPPIPPEFDMHQPPLPPPSVEVVWQQLLENDKIEILIDKQRVSLEKAISQRDDLRLFMVSMDDSDNSKINQIEFETTNSQFASQKIFLEVDTYPRFPGCEKILGTEKDKGDCAKKKMLEFVNTNLRYPPEARISGIEGSSVIKFVVEPDGSVTALDVVRDIGGGTKEAVEAVIQKMAAMETKWTPGIKDGKAVRVMYHLPIRFRLEGDSPAEEIYEYFSFNSDQVINETLDIVADNIVNDPDKEIYKVVEQMPYFPGCEGIDQAYEEKLKCGKKGMLEFIYTNLKYPEDARINNIEGINVVQFVVEKDGSFSEMKLVRDIGGGTGEETMIVMSKMQEDYTWTPGHQDGKAVRVLFTLPVRFKLDDSDSACCENQKLKDIQSNDNAEKPFFVIDGKAMGSMPVNLDTDEIKNVNVLKGSEAIAKYGAKAKHGVVLVETKDGDFDIRNITVKNPKPKKLVEGEVYKIVEEMPRFPGCEDFNATKLAREQCAKKELLQFIYMRLNYPKEAREKGIDGTAIVQFVIDKNGNVTNPKVVRDIEGAFEGAVLAVIEEMILQEKIWTPGKQNGKPVNVLFTMPIKFMLEQSGVEKQNQPSQDVKKEDLEDPNEIESWITGLAPEKVLNISSTSTLSNVTIDYYTDKVGPVNIAIYNTTGQLLKNDKIDVLKGKNTKSLSLSAGVSGIYIITLTQENSKISRKTFLN